MYSQLKIHFDICYTYKYIHILSALEDFEYRIVLKD